MDEFILEGRSHGSKGGNVYYELTERSLVISTRMGSKILNLYNITGLQFHHNSNYEWFRNIGTVTFLYKGQPGYQLERVQYPDEWMHKLDELAERDRLRQRLESMAMLTNMSSAQDIRKADESHESAKK